ncbi:SDR family oxidoreductase [Acuticoccus sp. MNP-M23]|uniref:SDR family NAD(P)-dependent oxidoreductase n=1 Tax=Acuticoccus sp. MNP-M23 TaxID=3072793 RepID=UPI002815CF2A|nr:SDR family oxidoreductase [Acuticoccus sp. MNP-M23]WMS44195.1 SDR family oxidoreductase [Acuticoccus sp. MNP-M23]
MDLKLNGRRAIITGGSGGLGLATADILVAEGATVILTDLDEDAVTKAAKKLGVDGIAADLSTTPGAEELYKKTGDVDILIHAAGVTGAKGDPLEMKDEDWDEAHQIDFMSAVRMARLYGPAMIEKGWGRMVFVTSENAAQPYPDESVYNVAKVGIASFAKSVSMQHAGKGLLANCVAPAFIKTPMTDGMMEKLAKERGISVDEAVEVFLAEERPYLALKRRGEVEEVAPVIALLASERASFVVGANWRVDGGAVGTISL